LTLKATSGGSAVPFADARIGVVYELTDPSKLKYCLTGESSSSASGVVKYASVVKDYATKPFAVFADAASAREYAVSGTLDGCLPYVAAGPVVSPDNPAWKLAESGYTGAHKLASEDSATIAAVDDLTMRMGRLEKMVTEIGKGVRNLASTVTRVALVGPKVVGTFNYGLPIPPRVESEDGESFGELEDVESV